VDDEDDREYSRAPELEDLLTLCQALNAEGVRYVLSRIKRSRAPAWTSDVKRATNS
jgi:hypothetical protein